jgi:hypothetical protein
MPRKTAFFYFYGEISGLEDQVQSRLDAAMKTEQERMQQAEEAANR